MQEKYGFVYIWRDKKHARFYLGCHWGKEDDGYICSSTWMKNAYKRRPQDFKRRIIARVYTNRNDMLDEEFRWLQLIPSEELGKSYYNLNQHRNGHWSTDETKLERQRKISSAANKGKRRSPTTEFKKGEHRSPKTQFQKGMIPHNKGKKLDEVVGAERAKEIKQRKHDKHVGKSFSTKTQFKKGQNTGSTNPRARSIITPYGTFGTQKEASISIGITQASLNYKLRSNHHLDWSYL